MADYRKLDVWTEAMSLAHLVYRQSRYLPPDERFGLSIQMRRAACSIPSNVAEGRGRGSDRDFARFVSIAIGSLNELETQALLARDFEYLDKEQSGTLLDRCSRLGRMLDAFRSQLLASSR